MIAGVCTGIAAYFGIDPTIVRVIFVGLLFLTKGVFAIAYFVLAFVLPSADTAEDRAAAGGQVFNAQQLIDRAKQEYGKLKDGRARRRWRRQQRRWRREWRQAARYGAWSAPAVNAEPASYGARVLTGVLVPVLTLVSVALFWTWLYAIYTLVTRQEVLGWPLPDTVPLWAGILVLVLIYQSVSLPLHAARRSSYYVVSGGRFGTIAAFDGLLAIGFAVLVVWLGYQYVPEIHDFLDGLTEVWRTV
jgi:phage shock protein PspC (stress-responsive transcriptional regulator)